MQLRKNRFFLFAHGSQLDNGVTSPWVLAIVYIYWLYPPALVGVSLWWTHRVYMVQLSALGSMCSFGGIVGSLYVMVLALKCAITCDFGKDPSWGLKL